MNRRTFLKLLGVALVAPAVAIKAVSSYTTKLPATLLSRIKWHLAAAKKRGFRPITIDGKEYYVVMMHPYQAYQLKVISARDKYKHEQWVKRYNRWRTSRGEALYQEIKGEIGVLNG